MDDLVRRGHPVGASADQDVDRLDDHRKEEDHDCRKAKVRGFQLATGRGCRSVADVVVVHRDEAARRQQDERRQADRGFVGPEHRAAERADADQMGLDRVGPRRDAKAARAAHSAPALVPEEFGAAVRPEQELQAWLRPAELPAVALAEEAEPLVPLVPRNLAQLELELAAQQREQAASVRLALAAEAAQPPELLASQQWAG